jgi:RNA polymerase sigma-70 factor, ECF subfamily
MCYNSPPTNFLTGTVYLLIATEDEARFVERCLAGDTTAFQPLVERYHRPLFAAAYRLLGDREEARDATQDAFLKAYQALRTFDPRRRFFSWIYRILVNECLNMRRARKPMVPLDARLAATRSNSPDVPAQQADARRILRRALMELSPEQREVIVLRHFEGLSYVELAEAIGVPEKTVKSRLFSARQRLLGLLAGKAVWS